MFGLLNLDKPAGLTSRDAVNRVQRLVRPVKVGHAGTLDPLATGVLVVCLGPATRLVPYLHEYSKTYVAEFLLGFTSDSDDVETELRATEPARRVSADEVLAMLPKFTGTIEQVPPAHSAVQIEGRRAYAMARQGLKPALKPRQVHIQRLELSALSDDRLTLEIECSSGTYIRSLGRDIGALLGCDAVMCSLRRTRVGPLRVETAVDPRRLTRESLAAALLPPQLAVADWPACTASDEETAALERGLRIQPAGVVAAGRRVAVSDTAGRLVALAESLESGELAPRTVFAARH